MNALVVWRGLWYIELLAPALSSLNWIHADKIDQTLHTRNVIQSQLPTTIPRIMPTVSATLFVFPKIGDFSAHA